MKMQKPSSIFLLIFGEITSRFYGFQTSSRFKQEHFLDGIGVLQQAECVFVGRRKRKSGCQFSDSFSSSQNSNNENDSSIWSKNLKPLTYALARLDEKERLSSKWKTKQIEESSSSSFVYYLEAPDKSEEWNLVVFVGGAALGEYPHVTYSELLSRLSMGTNAAIMAIPYSIQSLDHMTLSKQVVTTIQCALSSMDIFQGQKKTFLLGHSLGTKLQLIALAASPDLHFEFDGIGWMAFNNFGFIDSLRMSQQLLSFVGPTNNNPMFDTVFEFASTAAQAMGLEFSPSPSQTEALINAKFLPEIQKKSRLFRFKEDNLDSSSSLLENAPSSEASISQSYLIGTHLTPVYLQVSIDDLTKEVSLKDLLSNFPQKISYGNEQDLSALVQELILWMKGERPSEETGYRLELDRQI